MEIKNLFGNTPTTLLFEWRQSPAVPPKITYTARWRKQRAILLNEIKEIKMNKKNSQRNLRYAYRSIS